MSWMIKTNPVHWPLLICALFFSLTQSAYAADQVNRIVVIDGSVKDYQILLDQLPVDTESIVLQSDKDGLVQLADYLKTRSNIDELHFISHGRNGELQMGNVWLSNDNIQTKSGYLSQVGQSLGSTGDLLLYGCDLAKDEQGQAFVAAIAKITGKNVAASNNLTGASGLGGDWNLEMQVGQVTSMPKNFNYSAVLAPDQVVSWPQDTIWVRPGGTSYSWTWGVSSTHGSQQITQTAFWNVPDPGFEWYLDYGYFQYSTDNGANWTTYNVTNTSYNDYQTTAGKLWRFVNTNTLGAPANSQEDRIGFGFYLGATGYGTSGFAIREDAAPPTSPALTPAAMLLAIHHKTV